MLKNIGKNKIKCWMETRILKTSRIYVSYGCLWFYWQPVIYFLFFYDLFCYVNSPVIVYFSSKHSRVYSSFFFFHLFPNIDHIFLFFFSPISIVPEFSVENRKKFSHILQIAVICPYKNVQTNKKKNIHGEIFGF